MFAPKRLRITFLAFLIGYVGFAQRNAPASAGWKRVIVRCAPSDLDEVKRVLGAAVLDASHGQYLLNVSTSTNIAQVSTIHGHEPISTEDDDSVSLRKPGTQTITAAVKPPISLGPVSDYYGAPAPQAYTGQQAVSQIALKAALKRATGNGVRVAVIDTGIDFRHPVFRAGVILPGRNYVGRTTVPSEYDDPILTQSAAEWIELNQSAAEWIELNQSAAEWIELTQSAADWIELNQSSADWIELSSVAPEFGHGTMTAGLVHLLAPRAQLIPLKAFDAAGSSTQWIISRAIMDAVDMGADVINMSFSSPRKSQTIADAVSYATSKGVVLVGSAGNDNVENPTYPASLNDVIAVTSVSPQDAKAPFANYGQYVDVSAPGMHLITTFPHGFASVNGTSESAPIVAGVIALAKDSGVRTQQLRAKILAAVDVVNAPSMLKNKLGSGRINASKAILN